MINLVLPPLIAQMYAQGKRSELERALRIFSTIAGVPSLVFLTGFMLLGGQILVLLSAAKVAAGCSGSCRLVSQMTGHHKQAGQQADPPAFYRRSPAGGARLQTCGGRGGGRNHGMAERNHGADRQEADRGVDPRELLPLVVPESPLEPVSAPRRGDTSPVFQRLASRRSTEDLGQEVRRGETVG
jgi:hypothetical protein